MSELIHYVYERTMLLSCTTGGDELFKLILDNYYKLILSRVNISRKNKNKKKQIRTSMIVVMGS